MQRLSKYLAGMLVVAGLVFSQTRALPPHSSQHKNGGPDEIATETPAAYVIPKAGSDGKINSGYVPDLATSIITSGEFADARISETSVTQHEAAIAISKSQAGLGNVENYGVASQGEAEAGTATNKYMTPERVSQALAALGAGLNINGLTGQATPTDISTLPIYSTADGANRKITIAQLFALMSPGSHGTVLTAGSSTYTIAAASHGFGGAMFVPMLYEENDVNSYKASRLAKTIAYYHTDPDGGGAINQYDVIVTFDDALADDAVFLMLRPGIDASGSGYTASLTAGLSSYAIDYAAHGLGTCSYIGQLWEENDSNSWKSSRLLSSEVCYHTDPGAGDQYDVALGLDANLSADAKFVMLKSGFYGAAGGGGGSGDIEAVGDCASGSCFQTAAQNHAFLGPVSGGAGQGAFRAIADADLPAEVVYNDTTNTFTGYQNMSGGSWRPPEKAVADLPTASSNTGKVYIATDGDDSGDCTSGGGSTRALCVSNGSAWVALGGAGGGGGGGCTAGDGLQEAGDCALSVDSTVPGFLAFTFASLDFANVPANSQVCSAQTATGVQVGDTPIAGRPAALNIELAMEVFASASDELTICLRNGTTGAVNPTSHNFNAKVLIAR